MYILDSSVLIELFSSGSRAEKILSMLDQDPAVTTSINVHEILRGIASPKNLFIAQGIFSRMRILDYDYPCAISSAKIYNEQKKSGQMINSNNILIAGIAKFNGATILTSDHDFKKIRSVMTIIV